MYNVKGPSKIVAKTTRRGMSQNMDSLRDNSKNKFSECEDAEVHNGPKPVFQSNTRKSPNSLKQKTDITPQHQEMINYISGSWKSVCDEMVASQSSNDREMDSSPSSNDRGMISSPSSNDRDSVSSPSSNDRETVSSPSSNDRKSQKSAQSVMYYEDDPSPMLQNFKPFDLESWWGKRLFTSITNSVNNNKS